MKKVLRLASSSRWQCGLEFRPEGQFPGGQMQEHHGGVEAAIPHFGGTMVSGFKSEVVLYSTFYTYRRFISIMFQIKKSVFLALTLALLIALSACTETQPQVAASGRTSGTEVSSADLFPSSPLAEEPPATALAESSGETSDTQGTPPSNLPPSSPNEKPQTTVPSEPPKQTIDTPETPSTDNGPTQDQTTSSPDYEITVNEDGTLTIKRYVGPGGDVVIPSEIDGKLVSAIGNIADIGGAFQDCTTVTSVVIPDGVTEIQDNAFYGCTALESVTVPASVTLLRNCAFCDCPNLRAVYFEGDAPQQANYVFDSTENVTMYYREGTSGWSNPWHGRPAETYAP